MVNFFCKNGTEAVISGGSNGWEIAPKFSGTQIVEVSIPSDTISGEYYLRELHVKDVAGNGRSYFYDDSIMSWTEPLNNYEPVQIDVNEQNNYLLVKNEFDVNFQTHITNPNVITKLAEMPEGTCGMILFDQNNHTMKKEWFDEIKGKDKTIVMSYDGIQWFFNGKDIVNETKDISCYVDTNAVAAGIYNSNEEVLEFLFHSNGMLPGKATVRIKEDYILNLYNLSNELYLYYKDTDKLTLEDNPEYFKDGDTHWCEFEVTHNSTFVMSGNEIVNLDLTDSNVPGTSANNGTLSKGDTVIVRNGMYTVSSADSSGVTLEFKENMDKSATKCAVPPAVIVNKKVCKVTSIAPNAFRGCTKLKSIMIGAHVKTIGANAFSGCKNLKKVVYNSGKRLEIIGNKAFYKCTSLTKFVIPANVKKSENRRLVDAKS